MGASSALFWASRFAYDTLVNSALDGTVQSGLASDWSQDEEKVVFTIKDGITCSDGSAFTAATAAANINFISDMENASPMLGAFLPVGVTAEAEGSTLTLHTAEPAPFILSGLSDLFMVCDAGLADRSTLAAATNGTGPYALTEAEPNDHYTYQIRDGYTWGPDGAATDGSDMPGEVVIRVIENETTAANLLLSGEVNAALIFGADSDRLDQAGLFSVSANSVIGEAWYNHAEGHVTSDPAVREALVKAVDLAELRQVLTSGKGTAPTTFATVDPVPCPGEVISANLPTFDLAAAQAVLEEAGWVPGADSVRVKDGVRLKIVFIHDSALGDPGAAAAELARAAWVSAGFEVEQSQLPTDQVEPILFGSGAWDVMWEPINISSPDQIVGFVSGPDIASGGTNFASIDNAGYVAKVASAMEQLGTAGCATWLEAEAELVKANDVTPFANNQVKLFGSGAEFGRVSTIMPTSIKMVG
jgi:peptide/nickel transport system substrate-binding protein